MSLSKRAVESDARQEQHELVWALAGDLEHDIQISAHLADLDARLASRKPARWYATPWALAASIVIAALCVGLYYSVGMPSHYVTRVGEQRTIELRDHSRVHLNTNTRVNVRYTPWSRVVEVEHGEAVFTVEKDARRPFLVHAGTGDVRAVGTQFGVWLDDSRVRVTVLEGVVAVRGTASSVAKQLRAGTALDYDASGVLVPVTAADTRRVRAWMEGRIEFQRERLDLVLAEFSRYSTRPLVLADQSLAPIEVTGVFRVGAVDALLLSLQNAFGLEVKRTPSRIILAPSPLKSTTAPVST